MKGKVLSIITAVLFGATMLAAPIVYAAGEPGAAGTEEKAPEKKPAKKAKKKEAKKKTTKKAAKKKAARRNKHQPKKRNSFRDQHAASLRDRRKSGLCKTCRSIQNRRQVLFFLYPLPTIFYSPFARMPARLSRFVAAKWCANP